MRFYHGTRAAYLPSIEQNGLIPRAQPGNDKCWRGVRKWGDIKDRDASVFITPKRDLASDFAQRLAAHADDKPAVVSIELPDEELANIHQDEAAEDSDFRRFKGAIKPEWIVGAKEVKETLSGLLFALSTSL